MEIRRWKNGSDNWEMVTLSKKEALALIVSLSRQLLEDNPNVGRLESRVKDKDGHFFTIAVVEDPYFMPKKTPPHGVKPK